MAELAGALPFPLRFDPASTALIVIDMQRDFVEPAGFGAALGNELFQPVHLSHAHGGLQAPAAGAEGREGRRGGREGREGREEERRRKTVLSVVSS